MSTGWGYRRTQEDTTKRKRREIREARTLASDTNEVDRLEKNEFGRRADGGRGGQADALTKTLNNRAQRGRRFRGTECAGEPRGIFSNKIG